MSEKNTLLDTLIVASVSGVLAGIMQIARNLAEQRKIKPAAFFGLVLGSILVGGVVSSMLQDMGASPILSGCAGTLSGYLGIDLVPILWRNFFARRFMGGGNAQ